jgi:splicing factor U2AF subunit
MATDDEEAEHLEEFYVDMWEELAKFGDVEQVYICENLGDHLIGNVYVKYFNEVRCAWCAVQSMRWI